MIIFKRVRRAFGGIQAREWALLSLEILGVVVGILIAFELNEWAVRRNDAARHQRLMERLHEESENDITVLREFRDLLKSYVEREQAFAVALAKGQCPPDKDFEAVSTLPLKPAMVVPTAVYQELMGAGGLSSIERQDVREKVAQFHNYLGWAQRQIEFFRAAGVRPIEPDDARLRIHFDPTLKDPEVATYDGAALCKDQKFKNRVASATRDHAFVQGYFQSALEDAISMCVRLGDSLGRPCEPPHGGRLRGEDAKYVEKVLTAMREDKSKQ